MAAVESVPKLVVDCDPASKVVFEGDFRTAIVVELRLKNRSRRAVLFKMKTTSPDRYLVQPHRGEMAANAATVMTITLLPFHYRPDQKYADKFLLQVCLKPSLSVGDAWARVADGVEDVLERKLACVFTYAPHKAIANSSEDEDNELHMARQPKDSARVQSARKKREAADVKEVNGKIERTVPVKAENDGSGAIDKVETDSIPVLRDKASSPRFSEYRAEGAPPAPSPAAPLGHAGHLAGAYFFLVFLLGILVGKFVL